MFQRLVQTIFCCRPQMLKPFLLRWLDVSERGFQSDALNPSHFGAATVEEPGTIDDKTARLIEKVFENGFEMNNFLLAFGVNVNVEDEDEGSLM